MAARGYGAPETVAIFERLRKLAIGADNADARFSINYGLWVGSYVRGELASMRQLVEIFLHGADGQPDSLEAGAASRIAGFTSWFSGDFTGARAHYEQALAAYNPERDRNIDLRFGLRQQRLE